MRQNKALEEGYCVMFIEENDMVERIVNIPDGVDIAIKNREIIVKGPKGEIRKDFDDPRYNETVKISKEGNTIKISSASDKRKVKALVGTFGQHIINMARGVTNGYKYTMKVYYSHFPISITVKDDEVHIKNFIGEKGARIAKIIGNVSVNVDKDEV